MLKYKHVALFCLSAVVTHVTADTDFSSNTMLKTTIAVICLVVMTNDCSGIVVDNNFLFVGWQEYSVVSSLTSRAMGVKSIKCASLCLQTSHCQMYYICRYIFSLIWCVKYSMCDLYSMFDYISFMFCSMSIYLIVWIKSYESFRDTWILLFLETECIIHSFRYFGFSHQIYCFLGCIWEWFWRMTIFTLWICSE
jgi:hypothetical protein